VQDAKPIRLKFRLRNTGPRAGTETAQVYVTLPSSTGEPSKRLAGWARVTLEAGEAQNVELTVDPASVDRPLSYWDGDWKIADGDYTVSVGGSIRTSLSDTIRVHPSGSANSGK
jgi:beta-glucosidase